MPPVTATKPDKRQGWLTVNRLVWLCCEFCRHNDGTLFGKLLVLLGLSDEEESPRTSNVSYSLWKGAKRKSANRWLTVGSARNVIKIISERKWVARYSASVLRDCGTTGPHRHRVRRTGDRAASFPSKDLVKCEYYVKGRDLKFWQRRRMQNSQKYISLNHSQKLVIDYYYSDLVLFR